MRSRPAPGAVNGRPWGMVRWCREPLNLPICRRFRPFLSRCHNSVSGFRKGGARGFPSSQKETVCSKKPRLCSQKETVCSRKPCLFSRNETVCSRKPCLCSQKETVCSQKPCLCSRKETVCSRKPRLCSEKETVCSQNKIVCSRKARLFSTKVRLRRDSENH